MIPKFRAWDKETKTMIEVSSINFEEHLILGGYWEFGQTESIKFDEIELMQSTGLLDKNGKEIFEGDILGIETDEGILNVNIFWDVKHALFMFESEIHNEKELLAELVEDNTYPFEILGNIYENTELLEVEE